MSLKTSIEEGKNILVKTTKATTPGRVNSAIVEGAPGTGKSYMTRKAAEELGARIVTISGNPEVCDRELLGYYELFSHGSSFRPGPIMQAVSIANADGIAVLEISESNLIDQKCKAPLYDLLDSPHCIQPPSGKELCLNDDAKLLVVSEFTEGGYGIHPIPEADELHHKIDIQL